MSKKLFSILESKRKQLFLNFFHLLFHFNFALLIHCALAHFLCTLLFKAFLSGFDGLIFYSSGFFMGCLLFSFFRIFFLYNLFNFTLFSILRFFQNFFTLHSVSFLTFLDFYTHILRSLVFFHRRLSDFFQVNFMFLFILLFMLFQQVSTQTLIRNFLHAFSSSFKRFFLGDNFLKTFIGKVGSNFNLHIFLVNDCFKSRILCFVKLRWFFVLLDLFMIFLDVFVNIGILVSGFCPNFLSFLFRRHQFVFDTTLIKGHLRQIRSRVGVCIFFQRLSFHYELQTLEFFFRFQERFLDIMLRFQEYNTDRSTQKHGNWYPKTTPRLLKVFNCFSIKDNLKQPPIEFQIKLLNV